MGKSTTIRIDAATKKELNSLGTYGDTHDTIIRKLIKRYRETEEREAK